MESLVAVSMEAQWPAGLSWSSSRDENFTGVVPRERLAQRASKNVPRSRLLLSLMFMLRSQLFASHIEAHSDPTVSQPYRF